MEEKEYVCLHFTSVSSKCLYWKNGMDSGKKLYFVDLSDIIDMKETP